MFFLEQTSHEGLAIRWCTWYKFLFFFKLNSFNGSGRWHENKKALKKEKPFTTLNISNIQCWDKILTRINKSNLLIYKAANFEQTENSEHNKNNWKETVKTANLKHCILTII